MTAGVAGLCSATGMGNTFPSQKPTAVDDLIRYLATRPLDFEPGTRWSHSNTGFLILGRVVEKVSGRTFAAFLTGCILTPLGMDHTLYEPALAGYCYTPLTDVESELSGRMTYDRTLKFDPKVVSAINGLVAPPGW